MADASAKLIRSMSVLKLYRDSLRLATHLGSKVRERERGGRRRAELGVQLLCFAGGAVPIFSCSVTYLFTNKILPCACSQGPWNR